MGKTKVKVKRYTVKISPKKKEFVKPVNPRKDKVA